MPAGPDPLSNFEADLRSLRVIVYTYSAVGYSLGCSVAAWLAWRIRSPIHPRHDLAFMARIPRAAASRTEVNVEIAQASAVLSERPPVSGRGEPLSQFAYARLRRRRAGLLRSACAEAG